MTSSNVPAESDTTVHGPGRSFDLRLVYQKTPAGQAEIVARTAPLSPAARRLLIVIDGQRTLADLPPFARPGELGFVIEELERRGLISLSGLADAPPPPDPAQLAAREKERLATLKRALQAVFEKELGDAGRVLDARLQDSVTVDVLRGVLRDGIDGVTAQRGEPAGRRLAELVRPLVSGRPNT